MKLGEISGKCFPLFCIASSLLLTLNFEPVQSENILVLLPMASKSHKNVFQPLIEGLAQRNHKLTVLSPFKPSKPKENIQEIVNGDFAKNLSIQFGDPFEKRSAGTIGLISSSLNFMLNGCHGIFAQEEFLSLLNQKFDLIFLDAFMNDCLVGFIYKLKAPLILVSPMAAPSSITSFTGNRLPPSFVPAAMLPYKDEMSFVERLINFCFNIFMDLFASLYMMPKLEEIYRQHMGENLPGIYEVHGNVSMIMMNSHFTLTFPRPTLPDVIEVGGMHCRPAKPLPKDLEEFIGGAKDGVIFFSLGSIVQGNQMPEKTRKIFLNVFSRLKQRVLWKWESGEMEGLPKNVKLGKWLPQQDILGHKNVKLFITHGGLLSTQEATYHGVPLIGIPIFGDQDLNMKQAERAGYALAIEILEVTEESLEKTIQEILTNQKYTDRANKLSELYRDQSETPLERAIFWSEYVMRHKGAPHLRSAARKLNFFQYHSLDVIAALAAALILVLWIVKVLVYKILSVLMSILFKKGDASEKASLSKSGKKHQ